MYPWAPSREIHSPNTSTVKVRAIDTDSGKEKEHEMVVSTKRAPENVEIIFSTVYVFVTEPENRDD